MDVFYRKVKILLSFQEQIDFRKSCDIMFLSETKGMINASNIQIYSGDPGGEPAAAWLFGARGF